MKQKGIICIETEWQITTRGNKRNLNTEPLLKFIGNSYGIPYIYRKVATKEELTYYLNQFHKKEFEKYEILYFSFHGNTQKISLENGEQLSLEDLSNIANGLFENRFIHFSSCRTLLGSDNILKNFKTNCGAKMVTGYTKSVATDLSATHDIALLQQILTKKHLPSIIRNMDKLYGGLEKELGFKFL